MKKFFIALSIGIMLLSSCNTGVQSSHTAEWSPDGKDSVVNVTYVNDNGDQSSFFMNYMLFHTLFNNGGYSNVYRYYQGHPVEFTNYTPAKYSNYSQKYTPKTSSYYSSPSRNNYSSKSNGTYIPPSRDYTVPRSYSSPSRSYSSPSRSYSSPSRSYSSPGRH